VRNKRRKVFPKLEFPHEYAVAQQRVFKLFISSMVGKARTKQVAVRYSEDFRQALGSTAGQFEDQPTVP